MTTNFFFGPVTLLVGSSDPLLKEILMNIDELKSAIQAANDKIAALTPVVTKISAETQSLLTKITELQDAVNNAGNVPQEVVDAVAALSTQADAVSTALAGVDALVPDAPTEPAEGGIEQPAG